MAIVDFTVSKRRYFVITLCKYLYAGFINWHQKTSFWSKKMYVTVLPNSDHSLANSAIMYCWGFYFTLPIQAFGAEKVFAIATEKRKRMFFEDRQSHSIWHLYSFVVLGVIFKLFLLLLAVHDMLEILLHRAHIVS